MIVNLRASTIWPLTDANISNQLTKSSYGVWESAVNSSVAY